MKATRFLHTIMRLGVLIALITLASESSLAQVAMPVAPTANTQFGRLSWYSSMSSFDGSISGSMGFGVYGQVNNLGATPNMSNPNGHGLLGFGVFGYTGANGLFGVAGHAMIAGAKRNVGGWLLAANSSADTSLTHTLAADSGLTKLSIGLEVGAGGGGAGTDGHVGWAIKVDSGDVDLDANNNTTYVNNLKIRGSFTGGNYYSQTTTNADVTETAGIGAVISATSGPGAGNTNPVFLGNEVATANGKLLELQKAGADVFTVSNVGDLNVNDVTSTAGTIVSINDKVDLTSTNSNTNLLVTSGSRTGYGTSLLHDHNAVTFQAPNVVGPAPNAALDVTRGANIDTLNISGQLQFSDSAVANFTGAKIVGMSGNNKYTQTSTAGTVAISSTTGAGVDIEMSGTDTNPGLLVNAGSTGNAITANTTSTGTAFFANGTSTGSLLELQKSGTDVVSVDANGKTTILDANTTGAFSLNVTNSKGGATGGAAATFTGSNRSAYSVAEQSDGNRVTFAIPTGPGPGTLVGGAAALSVFRGAVIDTLDISDYMEFGTGHSKANVDFTNANVTGLNFNDTNKTNFHPGVPQLNSTANPAIWVGDSTGTTANLLQLDSGRTGSTVTKFSVSDDGNTTINTNTGSGLTINSTGGPAITINGAVNVPGGATPSNQPSGNKAATIALGTRAITVTVGNTLVTANSNIICSVTSAAGDSYTATVVGRVAGTSFDVKVTCVEGDVPTAEDTTISYWIVN